MANEEWTVTMPKLGETVTEGELTKWLKQQGEEVFFDDPLFEVSTDKVDSEIPSPYDGVIAEILVRAGETVPVGTPLVRIVPVGAAVGRVVVPNRLPAATHSLAAAGGPDRGDPAAPQMGGSEGPAEAASGLIAPWGVAHDITMPKLGETVTEGTVSSWLKQVGDRIAFDDSLFEVSTDKVDSEIPSPYDGVLLEILVQAGETVPVGTPLARIGEPAAAAPAGSPSVDGHGESSDPNGHAPNGHAPAAAGPSSLTAGPVGRGGLLLSPLVRRLVGEARLDPAGIAGTGVGGRIRREDVQRAIAGDGAIRSQSATSASAGGLTSPAPSAAPAAALGKVASPAGGGDRRDEVIGLSRMRLAVADGMKRSQATSASVWTSVEVDFDNIEKVRTRNKERFKKETGSSLSYLPFVSRAVVDALRAFPTVNSSIDIDARTMTLHPYVNLGIAVDLDQQGLVVPVVRDADSLNIRGIAKKITELASAARSKKLAAADMAGSTFTITNPGPFASFASGPIINQPNVAILCTDGVKRRPVAIGDAIAIHPTGIVGLVYDHRAFDGSTASLFLLHIRDSLENKDWAPEVG